jgi:hypothetical protein
MIRLLSVSVCFPENVAIQLRQFKQQLFEQVGWFPSKNSEPHMTINVFQAGERELFIWDKFLVQFCRTISSFEIRFVKTNSYANGAFYLSPDKTSKRILIKLMKLFHSCSPLSAEVKITDPHVSIGRKLNDNQLKIANQLFSNRNFDIKFMCDQLTIREFDEERQQYRVNKHFDFGGPNQLSLF